MKDMTEKIAELIAQRKRRDEEKEATMPEKVLNKLYAQRETAQWVSDVKNIVLEIEQQATKHDTFIDSQMSAGTDSLKLMGGLLLAFTVDIGKVDILISLASSASNMTIRIDRSEKDIMLDNLSEYLAKFIILGEDDRRLLLANILYTKEAEVPFSEIITSRKLNEQGE